MDFRNSVIDECIKSIKEDTKINREPLSPEASNKFHGKPWHSLSFSNKFSSLDFSKDPGILFRKIENFKVSISKSNHLRKRVEHLNSLGTTTKNFCINDNKILQNISMSSKDLLSKAYISKIKNFSFGASDINTNQFLIHSYSLPNGLSRLKCNNLKVCKAEKEYKFTNPSLKQERKGIIGKKLIKIKTKNKKTIFGTKEIRMKIGNFD